MESTSQREKLRLLDSKWLCDTHQFVKAQNHTWQFMKNFIKFNKKSINVDYYSLKSH